MKRRGGARRVPHAAARMKQDGRMQMELQFHKYANLFPMMDSEQAAGLEGDILKNGLVNKTILLHSDGTILDGRNRYTVCAKHAIKFETETFAGTDDEALRHVVSVNLKRRHLTESQRAGIAAEIARLRHGSNRFKKTDDVEVQICTSTDSDSISATREEAASMMGVSRRTVNYAAKALRAGVPELSEAVKSGDLNVYAAAKAATFMPAEEIAPAIKDGSIRKRIREAERSASSKDPANLAEVKGTGGKVRTILSIAREVIECAAALDAETRKADSRFSKMQVMLISKRLSAVAKRFEAYL